MAQKILAGRCADPTLSGESISVKLDQVVIARAPLRALAEAREVGLKKTTAEVAIVYDSHAVTDASTRAESEKLRSAWNESLTCGLTLARPGAGFAAPVHLERFASPARLCITDEPRLAAMGGIGMLTLVVSPSMIGQALSQGAVSIRPPRCVQVLLSGRTRPFVCARDIALELLRRGIGDAVRRVEQTYHAPVVLEFSGPSVRLLSVSERAVLAGLAPQVGAAAAVFPSDERTEVFLRDQRRSKAHRGLSPDAGAPCDEILNIDLGAVDPLCIDEFGVVRSVRDVSGKPVSQVLLGGDSGVTLRDLAAAAALLKAKRVPPSVEFLVAIPSRQMLDVLAQSGALADLLATGARLIEPDARVMTGELYPSLGSGVSVRTHDLEPGPWCPSQAFVASAETLAYAVATGEMGDPRHFKRPVRVTIPRALPTDDVLVVRERKAAVDGAKKSAPASNVAASLQSPPWSSTQSLCVVGGAKFTLDALRAGRAGTTQKAAAAAGDFVAAVCASVDDVRLVAAHAPELSPRLRAVLAPFIPSQVTALLSGLAIAAFQVEESALAVLGEATTLELPAPAAFEGASPVRVALKTAGSKLAGEGKKDPKAPKKDGSKEPGVDLIWLAKDVERMWATSVKPRSIMSRARPA